MIELLDQYSNTLINMGSCEMFLNSITAIDSYDEICKIFSDVAILTHYIMKDIESTLKMCNPAVHY